MSGRGGWRAILLITLAAAALVVITPLVGVIRLQTGPERIILWSDAEVRCDDLSATFILWRTPQTAILNVDTDPVAPYPPFYYGGITEIAVDENVVKRYDPPLLDTDTVDVTQYLHTGINKVKVKPKVAAIICNLQKQATVNGYLEVTYPEGGGGGGGGTLPEPSIWLLGLGVGLLAVSAFVYLRGGGRG